MIYLKYFKESSNIMKYHMNMVKDVFQDIFDDYTIEDYQDVDNGGMHMKGLYYQLWYVENDVRLRIWKYKQN